MFLRLGHTKLDVYTVVQDLIAECYSVTLNFPADEKFNLTQQIKRAALSVKLNLAEGASRKSETERKRFYEIARGSVIEIDAALGVGLQLRYVTPEKIGKVGSLIIRCHGMLTAMTRRSQT